MPVSVLIAPVSVVVTSVVLTSVSSFLHATKTTSVRIARRTRIFLAICISFLALLFFSRMSLRVSLWVPALTSSAFCFDSRTRQGETRFGVGGVRDTPCVESATEMPDALSRGGADGSGGRGVGRRAGTGRAGGSRIRCAHRAGRVGRGRVGRVGA